MTELSDLEINRLCAQAQEISVVERDGILLLDPFKYTSKGNGYPEYDPIHDFGQCMQLEIAFPDMRVTFNKASNNWDARFDTTAQFCLDENRLRASSTCVAQMEKEKEGD